MAKLCQQTRVSKQKLEAMKWYFGRLHCRETIFTNDTAGDQAGSSFDLNVITEDYEQVKYLVWLDNGVASAPTPASDQTLLPVTYTNGDTANTIAGLYVAELLANDIPVRYQVDGTTAEVINKFIGPVTTESYSNAGDIELEVGSEGFGGYVGQTGEGELAIEETKTEVLDDATGTILVDEIQTGVKATISFSLREMTIEKWEDLVGKVSGSNVTINTKKITGYGTAKLYQSKFNYAGRLVGHPVRLDSDVRDYDICMPLTAPNLKSLNFSGQSIQEAPFDFVSYKDDTVRSEINLIARGDHAEF